jgi:hypothetical protein
MRERCPWSRAPTLGKERPAPKQALESAASAFAVLLRNDESETEAKLFRHAAKQNTPDMHFHI